MNQTEQVFKTNIGGKITVKEIFEYRGKTCLITLVEHNPQGLDIFTGMSLMFFTMIEGGKGEEMFEPHHNGYVQTKNNAPINFWSFIDQIDCIELSMDGQCFYFKEIEELRGKYFLGFDTGHGYNTEEDKTFEAVKKKTLELADEMEELGI